MVDFHNGINLKNLNHAAVGQTLPWQTQNQSVKLQAAQLHAARSGTPVKASLVQSPVGEPDAMAVMYQHFHPGTASVGKQVGMVRHCCTKHLYYPRQDRFRPGAHVEWFD